MPYFLQADQPELHWVNYLKGDPLPNQLAVEQPKSTLSVSATSLAAWLAAIVLFVAAIRRRSSAGAVLAALLAAAGWLVPHAGPSFQVPIPTSVRAPSAAEVRPTLHALLYNIYRALDFRDEEVVFDRLEQSLAGDILEQVYLEMRQGLRLENQGGARVRVREVDVVGVSPEEPSQPDTLRYRTKWNATGTVGHWGHTHVRTNAYDALVTLAQIGDRWKIAGIEILEEQRVLQGRP
jgi:hypothetical protein